MPPQNRWKFIQDVLGIIARTLMASCMFVLSMFLVYGIYKLAYMRGFYEGQVDMNNQYVAMLSDMEATSYEIQDGVPKPAIASPTTKRITQNVTWGGVELWEAVNNKRVAYGVNPLKKADELCTIASIRLNELLELGKLDGHEGFGDMTERRPDLKWIFDKYSTVAEFLAYGGQTPTETVELWDNTLGHKKLLDGGEFVWGCIYAQNTFAVAITAY